MKISDLSLVAALLAYQAEAIISKPPPNNITPHIVEGFVWADPFPQSAQSYEPTCEAAKHFWGLEYTLHDLTNDPPKGLKPWAEGLKGFFKQRQYPGGWSGYDRHGYDRTIMKMEYTDVPVEVRQWIENEARTDGPGKGLFGVFRKPTDAEEAIEEAIKFDAEVDRADDTNKVLIFAPGAIYHILPLWVAGESSCKGEKLHTTYFDGRAVNEKSIRTDQLLDLDSYKPIPADGNVIGWADHKRPQDHKTEFRVTVQALKEKPAPSAAEGVKEEL